jgi:RAB protein geranylgeranyltransferase component A
MSGTLDPHYDFALLGTSLPLSILSAALSKAGYSVLHIDESDHYGGPWSSLTLLELLEWSRNTSLHQSQGKRNVSIVFPGSSEEPPPELAALNRHFSISLAPTIVPCAGPTIDVLIRSKVASYCTFRLLQKTSVYSAKTSDWPLRKVPSSKEDIFKDKILTLVDKRRLMKLLQQAVPEQRESDSTAGPSILPSERTFFDHLVSKQGANLSPELSTSIAYGVALCSSEQGERLQVARGGAEADLYPRLDCSSHGEDTTSHYWHWSLWQFCLPRRPVWRSGRDGTVLLQSIGRAGWDICAGTPSEQMCEGFLR